MVALSIPSSIIVNVWGPLSESTCLRLVLIFELLNDTEVFCLSVLGVLEILIGIKISFSSDDSSAEIVTDFCLNTTDVSRISLSIKL